MKRIFLLLTLLFLNILSASALLKEDVSKLWLTASGNYTNGEYAAALESYQQIERQAGVSASLYYNIGNCYFKENRLAKAILYYSKAHKLDPSNEDVVHNLAVANALTTNKIKQVPEFFLYRWMEGVVNMMSSDTWAQLSIITFAVLLSMLIAFLLSKKSNRRKITFTIGLIALIFTIIAGVASTFQRTIQLSNEAGIIMNNAVAVKSSPDNSGKDIFILNEGVKVKIKEQIGKWSKITIASGDTGWISTESIEII